jgi:hypothetical protein
MNRVVLVNTFLKFTSLQFSISTEQLLLGTSPLRNHSSAKIPNSIRSGIKLDLKKLVFVVFFGILPLNVKSNISSDFGFWCSDPPCKMTKSRKPTLLFVERLIRQLRTCWKSLYLYALCIRLVPVVDSFFSVNIVSFSFKRTSEGGKFHNLLKCWTDESQCFGNLPVKQTKYK